MDEQKVKSEEFLRGWEKKISAYLGDDTVRVSTPARMVFLPHKEVNDALTLLSDTHPGFVTEIRDAVQVCSDASEGLPKDETAVGDMESTAASYLRGAMEVLARRIVVVADALARL